MTEIAKELLEDVKLGDRVKVRYGTSTDQDIVEGVITKITENFLHLQKDNGGVTKIRLDDSLRSLDPIESNAAAVHPIESNIAAVPTQPSTTLQQSVKPIQNHQQFQLPTQSSMFSNSTRITKSTSESFHIKRNFVTLSKAEPYDFEIKTWIGKLKALTKKVENQNLRNDMNSIFDALNSAIKNNQVSYKYHDLRARILLTWEICNADVEHEIFYLSLGILAVAAKDYLYSLEPLVRAKEYSLAAYAALTDNQVNDAEIFKCCALLSGQESEIDQNLADICIKRKDSEVIAELLNNNQDDADYCEKLASCAHLIFETSNGKLTSNIEQNCSAYEATQKLLDSVPKNWKSHSIILDRWQEYKKYVYPQPRNAAVIAPNEPLIGKIYRYDLKNWGFISPGHYFYIKQVCDNSEQGILLRKMLYLGLWNQLEVSFRLGESPSRENQSAATHVELTEAGYEEAKRRIEDGEMAEKKFSGFIEIFYGYPYMNGRIQADDDGTIYKFGIDDIIDPWLKALYKHGSTFMTQYPDVTFEIFGRNKAVNICWKNPPQDYNETYSDYVTAEDMDKWKAFLEEQHGKKEKISLPTFDPYQSFYYVDLPEWHEEGKNYKQAPLTWTNKKSPEPEQPSYNDTKKSKQAAQYAEQGRRDLSYGNFEEAEQNFENALEIGGFNESRVSDLISTYLRQHEKFDKALQLLDKYEKFFSRERLINLKIGIFSKKKDYKNLAPLYEKLLNSNMPIIKRSYYLFNLMDAYINIEEYEEALNVCRRWEMFYQQNYFSFESNKLKNALPRVNRNKALCNYFLGNVKKAQELAESLIRANPHDEIARKILADTLNEEHSISEENISTGKVEDDENSIDSTELNFEANQNEDEPVYDNSYEDEVAESKFAENDSAEDNFTEDNFAEYNAVTDNVVADNSDENVSINDNSDENNLDEVKNFDDLDEEFPAVAKGKNKEKYHYEESFDNLKSSLNQDDLFAGFIQRMIGKA